MQTPFLPIMLFRCVSFCFSKGLRANYSFFWAIAGATFRAVPGDYSTSWIERIGVAVPP
jgi:hypothetical protein